jgi:enoyl-CoA hydratase
MIELTLDAPGKNALSTPLMTWILDRLAEAGGEPILLSGAGDTFSAGLNLREVASLDLAGMRAFLQTLERMVEALYSYPGPLVGWINGHAIAGGCVLALACDCRLMTNDPRARMGLNEVPLGLRFPPKTWRMIERRVPAHSIDRVVLEGGLYPPETALRLGLVDELVADEAAAKAIAHRIADAPRAAYVAAKRALRKGALALGPGEAEAFVDEVVPTWVTPELKARLAARLGR